MTTATKTKTSKTDAAFERSVKRIKRSRPYLAVYVSVSGAVPRHGHVIYTSDGTEVGFLALGRRNRRYLHKVLPAGVRDFGTGLAITPDQYNRLVRDEAARNTVEV